MNVPREQRLAGSGLADDQHGYVVVARRHLDELLERGRQGAVAVICVIMLAKNDALPPEPHHLGDAHHARLQRIELQRFLDDVERSALQRLCGRDRVRASAHHDDADLWIIFPECLEKSDAAARQTQVEKDEVWCVVRSNFTRLIRRGGAPHQHAQSRKESHEAVAHDLVVIHDEHRKRWPGLRPGGHAGGSTIVAAVPCAGVLSSESVPPCPSTILLESERPMPVAPFVEKNSSKTRGRTSVGMAGPSLCSRQCHVPSGASDDFSESLPPSGAASTALPRTFRNTSASCCASMLQETGGSARARSRCKTRLSMLPRCFSSTPSHTTSGSPGCSCSGVGRPYSNSAATTLFNRSTSRRIRPTFFSTIGSSFTRKRRSCAADEMPKSGLLSSCATPADTSPMASERRLCPWRAGMSDSLCRVVVSETTKTYPTRARESSRTEACTSNVRPAPAEPTSNSQLAVGARPSLNVASACRTWSFTPASPMVSQMEAPMAAPPPGSGGAPSC